MRKYDDAGSESEGSGSEAAAEILSVVRAAGWDVCAAPWRPGRLPACFAVRRDPEAATLPAEIIEAIDHPRMQSELQILLDIEELDRAMGRAETWHGRAGPASPESIADEPEWPGPE